MAGRKITVEFLGNDKTLSSTAEKAERSTGRLGAKLKTVGKVAATGLAAGAAVAGVALFKMAQGAAEDEAAQARLANQLRNSAGATDKQIAGTEKWISAQGRALGVTDDELRPALSRLVTATGDVDKAQRLAALAMDVSAGTGKSLEQVSTALMKAQNGQVAGLSKLGIQTKNAKGETISFEQAQKQMADTFKGAAEKNANTLSGKMTRLKVALAEAGETIGSKLLPILTRMAEWAIRDGLPAMQRLGGWIKSDLVPIFKRIASVVQRVMGSMRGDVGGNMGEIKSAIQDFVTIVRVLWDKFGKHILQYARSTFNNIRTAIKGVLNIVIGIVKVFAAVLKGDWKKAWEGVKQILRGAGQVLRAIVGQLFNVLRLAVKAGATALVSIFRGIPGMLRALGGAFLNAGSSLIGKIFSGIKSAASRAGGFISDLASQLMSAVKGAINSALDLPLTISFNKGPININATLIPAFAKGTTSAPGGWSLVGERGPELVNLTRGAQVVPNHRLGGAASSQPVIVQLRIGAKVVEQILIDHTRSTGRPLQVRTLGPA